VLCTLVVVGFKATWVRLECCVSNQSKNHSRHKTKVPMRSVPQQLHLRTLSSTMSAFARQYAVEIPAVVVDCGSECTRVGYSGAKHGPKLVLDTRLRANPLHNKEAGAAESKEGAGARSRDTSGSHEDVEACGSSLQDSALPPSPIQRRLVEDFDRYETVLRTSFTTLGAKRTSRALLLTEHSRNPVKNRLKTAELMFEALEVPAGYVWTHAALAMYGTGRTSGCVVDIGQDCCHASAIIDGHVLKGATKELTVGGFHVTKRMASLLVDRGAFPSTAAVPGPNGLARVEELKRRYAYAAGLIKEEVRKFVAEGKAIFEERNRVYRLPDGQDVDVGDEAFWAPEVLFHPTLLDLRKPEFVDAISGVLSNDGAGLASITSSCLSSCGEDWVGKLSRNVVLTGGGSLLNGPFVGVAV